MAQVLADSDIERLVAETRRQLQTVMTTEDEAHSAMLAGRGSAEQNVARLIDHTLLKPEASAEQITQLCQEAREYHFATVCVNSARVALAAELLRGSDVAVCAVVGFPLGASLPEAKAGEARLAIAAGAGEIDMVLNIGALKDRDLQALLRDIRTVVVACHDAGGALQGDSGDGPAQRRGEGDRLRCELRGGRGLCEDQYRLRWRRRDGGGYRADAARGGAGGGREGFGRGAFAGTDAQAVVAAGATRIGASAGVAIVRGERGEEGY